MSVHWRDSVYMSIHDGDHFFQADSPDYDDDDDDEYDSYNAWMTMNAHDPGNFAYRRPELMVHPADHQPQGYEYACIAWVHSPRRTEFWGLGAYHDDVFSSRRVKR